MRLDVASISQQGSRNINEDRICFGIFDGLALFAVADGLGGHGGGDIAASIAVQKTEEIFSSSSEHDDVESCLEQCFQAAHIAILEQCKAVGSRYSMKTTLAILTVAEDFKARWAHIGDSRLYYFPVHRRKRYLRTLDHSVTQSLVSRGEIKEDQVRFHEDRSYLLRALGEDTRRAEYDLSDATPLRIGDAILICTDGFWEWIPEQTMISCLKHAHDAHEWLGEMEQRILQAGTGKDMDNYSAIAIMVR